MRYSFKDIKWVKLLLLSFLGIALGMSSAIIVSYVRANYDDIQLTVRQKLATHESSDVSHKAFVLVSLDNHVIPDDCMDNEDMSMWDECPEASGFTITSRGSGVVIGTSKGVSYVLTASHVCKHQKAEAVIVDGAPYSYTNSEQLTVIGYDGIARRSMIVGADEDNDICLVLSLGVWTAPAKIAKNEPLQGEHVYNIAAPMGIFAPGMALLFDGHFSGVDPDHNAFYTIPAWPGSSGSPVFNTNGEVIGIIHSATPIFPNISVASRLEDIQSLLNRHSVFLH